MAHDPAVADLESFLAERGEPLLRTAVLLTGSKEAGEDLLQAGLERLLRHWHRIEGDPEGYLRRTLYNLAADGWRRQRAWRRRLPLLQNETATAVADGTREVDTRDALIRLLMQLPPRQRAVIVARYWEQLSEAETAAGPGLLGRLGQGVRLAGAAAAARAQRDQHSRTTWQRRRHHEHRPRAAASRGHGAVHRRRAGAAGTGPQGLPAPPEAPDDGPGRRRGRDGDRGGREPGRSRGRGGLRLGPAARPSRPPTPPT